MMQLYRSVIYVAIQAALAFSMSASTDAGAQTDSSDKKWPVRVMRIVPSETDPTITKANTPHLIMYDTSASYGKLLLFMTGTGGIADKGPRTFFTTAIEQGYRVISLSYIDVPAVSQACYGRLLDEDPDCAAEFRAKRALGINVTNIIDDLPQDAIISRFTMLLRYLVAHDPQGNWGMYLNEKGNVNWTLVALSGQSQGGGMASFIAKTTLVYKVITFSGGWDHSAGGRIARWYSGKSVTPPDRWYGTYHVDEDAARTILSTYRAMGIPEDHIKAFDQKVKGDLKAHTDGMHNIAYKADWIEMLGSGR